MAPAESTFQTDDQTRAAIEISVIPTSTKTFLAADSIEIMVRIAAGRALRGGVVTLAYNPSIIYLLAIHPFKREEPVKIAPRFDSAQGDLA